MNFEWDETKAAANVLRHGVSLDTAIIVFDDPNRVQLADRRRDYGEDRFSVTGMIAGNCITVVYTPRGENIRLISARRASARERKNYLLRV